MNNMNRNRPFVNSTCWRMFGRRRWIPILPTIALFMGGQPEATAAHALTNNGPVKVEIVRTNDGYQLHVEHKPFYIKGAGLGSGSLEKLVEHGANSFRTWRTEGGRVSAREALASARANGLYVTMGLDIGSERHGFNYDDPAAVARQLDAVKAEVLKYKDEPALIIWAIGNELNLDAKNPKIWDAVNDISKMIHQVDKNHLTTTPLAGFKKDVVQQVKTQAPDLDLLSFQMYADIVNLPRYLREAGWNSPYMVTEWGATGHWEVAKTDWGAPIENDSTTKANYYKKRFETAIQPDQKLCVGSYVFLWGRKQERTPTWYGMFLEAGEETAPVDVMHYLWMGTWPAVRSPQLAGAWLNGRTAYQNIHLKPKENYSARIDATDSSHNALKYTWEVLEESRDLKTGGDAEAKPKSIDGLVQEVKPGEIILSAPAKPGAYRLFAYVFNGKDRAAHVNIPFYVDQEKAASLSSLASPQEARGQQ